MISHQQLFKGLQHHRVELNLYYLKFGADAHSRARQARSTAA